MNDSGPAASAPPPPAPNGGEPAIPGILAILPMRNIVLFPGTVAPLNIGRQDSIRLLDETLPTGKIIGIVAQRDPDQDQPAPADCIDRMTKFSQDMLEAGILLAGEGLHPPSSGARVTFAGGEPTVIDGPFIARRHVATVSSAASNPNMMSRCEYAGRTRSSSSAT